MAEPQIVTPDTPANPTVPSAPSHNQGAGSIEEAAGRISSVINPKEPAGSDKPAAPTERTEERQPQQANQKQELAADQPDEQLELSPDDIPDDEADDLEATPTEGEANEQEADEKSREQSDAEGQEKELPSTVDALAETLGVDADELMNNLKLKVSVGGEEVEVNLAEAQAGIMMQRDYQTKTAELSEWAKTAMVDVEYAQQERQHYQGQLVPLIGEMQALLTLEQTEVAQLAASDPEAYIAAKARLDQKTEKLELAKRNQQGINQRQAMANEQARETDILKHTEKLVETHPHWAKDPQAGRKEIEAIKNYAVDRGVPREVVNPIYNHALLEMAEDSMKYRALLDKKTSLRAKKVSGKPKFVKPGSTNQGDKNRGSRKNAASNTFKTTGNIRDLVKVLAQTDLVD